VSQEPPGGWHQPPAQTAYPAEAYAVKRPLGRTFGFTVLSLGGYAYYWFYVTRKQLDGEVADGRDDAVLHTLGLLVPVLNFFVTWWLWRDLNFLRVRVGLTEFPAIAYLIGSIFLAPVFYSLVLNRVNEYWDVRTQGLATDAPVTAAEKLIVGLGAAVLALVVLVILIAVVLAIALSASS
jgi:hypothetical protein